MRTLPWVFPLLFIAVDLCAEPTGPWENRRLDEGGAQVLASYRQPALSPYGTHLAYVANLSSQSDFELYVQPVAGGEARKLSGIPGHRVSVLDFAFTPNGETLLYRARIENDRLVRRYAVEIAEGPPRELFVEVPGRTFDYLAIAGDSRNELILSDRGTADVHEIWRVPITGEDPVAITGFGTEGPPWLERPWRLSPDGRHFVFGRAGRVYSVEIEGNQPPVDLGDGWWTGGTTDMVIDSASTAVAFGSREGIALCSLDGTTSKTLVAGNLSHIEKMQFHDEDQRLVYMSLVIGPPFHPFDNRPIYARRIRSVHGDTLAVTNLREIVTMGDLRVGVPFRITGDGQTLVTAHGNGVFRIPLDGSESVRLQLPFTLGDLAPADDSGSLFLSGGGSLYYVAAGQDDLVPVPESERAGLYGLIDGGAALLIRRTDMSLAKVTVDNGMPTTEELVEANLGDVRIVLSTNEGPHVVYTSGQTAPQGSGYIGLHSVNSRNGEEQTLGERTTQDRTTDLWVVSPSWRRLAFQNTAALYAAASIGEPAREIPKTFPGSYQTFHISPNENYLLYSRFITIGPVPIAIPFTQLLLYTLPFSPSATPVNIYMHLVLPATNLNHAWGPVTISPDSRTITVINQEGGEDVIHVDDFGVPESARKNTGAVAMQTRERGSSTAPPGFEGAEVIAVRESAGGTRAAVLARFDHGPAELYVVRLPSGEPVKINGTLRPGHEVQEDFDISPEGRRVIYRADQGTGGVHLWLASTPEVSSGDSWLFH